MKLRKAVGSVGLVLLAGAVVAACSSSSHSSSQASSQASSTPKASAALSALEGAPSATLGAKSADVTIDLSVSGGVQAALSGGFDFSSGQGSLTMHVSGLPAADASLVPSELPMVFANGSLYLKAVGPISLADGSKPWAQLTPQALQGIFGLIEPKVNLGSFSTIASGNPADLLKILDTPDMKVTDEGSSSVDGTTATKYEAVIDAAKAASGATGQVADLYRALGTSSTPLYVWLDSSGRLIQLETTIHPAGAPTIDLSVGLSNFGTTVSVPTIPPSEVGPLNIPAPSSTSGAATSGTSSSGTSASAG
jgi:hypothetical protein